MQDGATSGEPAPAELQPTIDTAHSGSAGGELPQCMERTPRSEQDQEQPDELFDRLTDSLVSFQQTKTRWYRVKQAVARLFG